MSIRNLSVEHYRANYSEDGLRQMLYIGAREADPAVQEELRKIKLALATPLLDPEPWSCMGRLYIRSAQPLYQEGDQYNVFVPRGGYETDQSKYPEPTYPKNLDPMPYVNRITGSRYTDRSVAKYFTAQSEPGDLYSFAPLTGYNQDEQEYL